METFIRCLLELQALRYRPVCFLFSCLVCQNRPLSDPLQMSERESSLICYLLPSDDRPAVTMLASFSPAQLSFRELLPSESHRRSRRRLSLYSSDSDSRASSPSRSRPRTPASAAGSDLSPFSPSGEDSFFQVWRRFGLNAQHKGQTFA